MAYLLRPPEPDDAPHLGAVHVLAWQTAYRGGLMPDDYLDGLSADERADMWGQALAAEPRPRFHRLVAVDEASDRLVGFITVGPAGGDGDADEGEVFSLNVHPDHWGRGAGTVLLDGGVAALSADGFRSLILWVHPGNERACRFYEARGWRSDGAEKLQDVLGVTVPEVRYRRAPR